MEAWSRGAGSRPAAASQAAPQARGSVEFAIMREDVIMLPWRFLAALALTVFLAACLQSPPGRPALKAEKDRKTAPHFTLKDATGAAIDISDYRGKVVWLVFGATWGGLGQ